MENIPKIKHKDDLNARHPMDLRYMKLLRFLLRFIGSWPDQLLGEKNNTIFFLKDTSYRFVAYGCALVAGIFYLEKNFNTISFFELGNTYISISLNLVSMMYKYVNRICAVFVVVIHAESLFAMVIYNLIPVYNNFKTGMFSRERPSDKLFKQAVNFSFPFINYTSNVVGYMVMAFFNLVFTIDCCLCFIIFDITLCVIVFHTWGHLKILNNELQSISTPVKMRGQEPGRQDDKLRYSMEENKKVAAILKDIIDHHRMIMRFVTRTSGVFGPMLCLYYIFFQVSGCVLLLECLTLETESLMRYITLTLNIFQLFVLISVVIELLGSQSETLKDAVYSIPWEYMDTSNRKIVLFLLCNVQEPIRLKPLGLFSVGVQTMAAILKTTFSYYMMLRTFD